MPSDRGARLLDVALLLTAADERRRRRSRGGEGDEQDGEACGRASYGTVSCAGLPRPPRFWARRPSRGAAADRRTPSAGRRAAASTLDEYRIRPENVEVPAGRIHLVGDQLRPPDPQPRDRVVRPTRPGEEPSLYGRTDTLHPGADRHRAEADHAQARQVPAGLHDRQPRRPRAVRRAQGRGRGEVAARTLPGVRGTSSYSIAPNPRYARTFVRSSGDPWVGGRPARARGAAAAAATLGLGVDAIDHRLTQRAARTGPARCLCPRPYRASARGPCACRAPHARQTRRAQPSQRGCRCGASGRGAARSSSCTVPGRGGTTEASRRIVHRSSDLAGRTSWHDRARRPHDRPRAAHAARPGRRRPGPPPAEPSSARVAGRARSTCARSRRVARRTPRAARAAGALARPAGRLPGPRRDRRPRSAPRGPACCQICRRRRRPTAPDRSTATTASARATSAGRPTASSSRSTAGPSTAAPAAPSTATAPAIVRCCARAGASLASPTARSSPTRVGIIGELRGLPQPRWPLTCAT